MGRILLLTAVFFQTICFAQFGPIHVIDGSEASSGIKKIVTADMNNDGLNDIVVAQGFNIGNISFYLNNGNGSFSEKIIADALTQNPNSLAVADFNNDGWKDIITMSQSMNEVVWLPSNQGNFSERIVIDTNVIFCNAVVATDFDANGSPDFVVIGQHFITFYRNNGNGIFNIEPILTTSTSPDVLECMALETADMNNDGHPDLVTAETRGGVIYFNNGAGIFTPTVFTDRIISPMVHVFDANNDGQKDVLVFNSFGKVNLYLNSGNGDMQFHSEAFTAPNTQMRSLQTADMNGDGFADILTAVNFKAKAHISNGDNTFGNEIVLHQNPGIFITEVAVADLDQDNVLEYLWSGANHTLAYQKNTFLEVSENQQFSMELFPNPASEKIVLKNVGKQNLSAQIYNLSGQQLLTKTGSETIDFDISSLAKGLYFIHVLAQNDPQKNQVLKFIKH